MKTPIIAAAATGVAFVALLFVQAEENAVPAVPAQPVTLFSNVRIFDGKNGELSPPSHVLIRGNKIEKISAEPIATDRRADTTIIDGEGKTLMPGLIDAHVHTMMESIPMLKGLTSDIGYGNLLAARAAERQLLRGFTTVRDLGGGFVQSEGGHR